MLKNRDLDSHLAPPRPPKSTPGPPKSPFLPYLMANTTQVMIFDAKIAILAPILEPKSAPKSKKIEFENRYVFYVVFFMVWAWFWRGFSMFFWSFFELRSKTPFSRKPLFFLSKITVFQVRSHQKSLQNLVENVSDKKSWKITNFDQFWEVFGTPKSIVFLFFSHPNFYSFLDGI